MPKKCPGTEEVKNFSLFLFRCRSLALILPAPGARPVVHGAGGANVLLEGKAAHRHATCGGIPDEPHLPRGEILLFPPPQARRRGLQLGRVRASRRSPQRDQVRLGAYRQRRWLRAEIRGQAICGRLRRADAGYHRAVAIQGRLVHRSAKRRRGRALKVLKIIFFHELSLI